MTEYKKSLIYTILFCFLITLYAVYDIRVGYVKETSAVYSRVTNTSFLIAQWIESAFIAPDYVLRDIVNNGRVNELLESNQDPMKQVKTTKFLKSKLETLPSYFKEIGVANKNCIATSAYTIPPIPTFIGMDGSDREWCKVYRKDPTTKKYMTRMFLGTSGTMIISLNRPIRISNGKVNGLVGIQVELDFFQKWLEKVTIKEHGVVAIADTNINLLARKPALSKALSKKVNDEIVEAFIASNESYKSFRNASPLDNKSRFYGVRKINDMPFIIVVGEADEDWLKNWKQKTFATVVIVAIFWILSILILRNHWKQLQLRKELDYQANTDVLTGVSNRRFFINKASHELKRVQRYKTNMALLVLDIDRFKLINDNNGHATGDRAIIDFTKACKKSIRDIDILGRLGGDEFSILLLNTDIKEAQIVTERIRLAIESCEFLNDKGETISMTSSIGVAMIDSNISNVNDMMAIADGAVYVSKEKGRNRIEFATQNK